MEDRTPAGAAFNDLVGQVVELNRRLTAAAETLTRPAGQTLARWLVLAECRDEPATVADIARRLKLARQSVQRVADLLVDDGLCAYRDNPRHRRAKLLALTARGRATLGRIEAAQRDWADEVGGRVGERELRAAQKSLAAVLEQV
ncbi:MAG TPA: MarR family transcriptional regulator [Thermoleophilaceae bacterium]